MRFNRFFTIQGQQRSISIVTEQALAPAQQAFIDVILGDTSNLIGPIDLRGQSVIARRLVRETLVEYMFSPKVGGGEASGHRVCVLGSGHRLPRLRRNAGRPDRADDADRPLISVRHRPSHTRLTAQIFALRMRRCASPAPLLPSVPYASHVCCPQRAVTPRHLAHVGERVDVSCSTDADCMFYTGQASCLREYWPMTVSAAGRALAEADIARIEAALCEAESAPSAWHLPQGRS